MSIARYDRAMGRKNMSEMKWIPCSERMPKPEVEVLAMTDMLTITSAMYEDGTVLESESIWGWNDCEFDYSEEDGDYKVSEGWWEYRHFNPDNVYNNAIDEKVIAWMPLPEPYREEA